jgi:hypothetical protein
MAGTKKMGVTNKKPIAATQAALEALIESFAAKYLAVMPRLLFM